MRALGAVVVVVAVLSGCSSVKVSQRDGCWVRRTKKFPGLVREDVGPCARPASPWSDDRLTRLVQECVAREDYRWQMRALAAWSRGEPMPPEEHGQNVLATCTTEAARAGFAENDALKSRLEAANERLTFAKERAADLASDRDALRKRSDVERDRMYASHERLAEALGEAAKKASPPATATATASSDGRAQMDSRERRSERTSPPTAPVAFANATPWIAPPAAPTVLACAPSQPATATAAKRPRAQKPVVAAKAPECVPPAAPAPAAQPGAGQPARPVFEAGSAVAAPVQGQVVKAAEEKAAEAKPAIVPAPAPAAAGDTTR